MKIGTTLIRYAASSIFLAVVPSRTDAGLLIATGNGAPEDSFIRSLTGTPPMTADKLVTIPAGNFTDVQYVSGTSGPFWASRNTGSPGPAAPPGIFLFDESGNQLQDYPINDAPTEIAINAAGRVFVAGGQGRMVSPNPGTGLVDFVVVAGPGPSPDGFRDAQMTGVDVDPAGNVYYSAVKIADPSMHAFYKVNQSELGSAPLFIPFADPSHSLLQITTDLEAGVTCLLYETSTSLLYGTNAGSIFRADLVSGSVSQVLELPGSGSTEDLAFAPNGNLLANRGGTLFSVDMDTLLSSQLYSGNQRIFGITGVPEPGTLALMLIAAVAVTCRHWPRVCHVEAE